MINTLTVTEAWDKIDELYPIKSVYDCLVLKQDWAAQMDIAEQRAEAIKNLTDIEKNFGLRDLDVSISLLEERLLFLEVPILSYKISLPEDFEQAVKAKRREIEKKLSGLKELHKQLSDTIQVELDMLLVKN